MTSLMSGGAEVVGGAVAPFHPARVVQKGCGVGEAGAFQEQHQVVVAEGDTEDLVPSPTVHRDAPAPGQGGPVHHDGSTGHTSSVLPGPRPGERRGPRPGRVRQEGPHRPGGEGGRAGLEDVSMGLIEPASARFAARGLTAPCAYSARFAAQVLGERRARVERGVAVVHAEPAEAAQNHRVVPSETFGDHAWPLDGAEQSSAVMPSARPAVASIIRALSTRFPFRPAVQRPTSRLQRQPYRPAARSAKKPATNAAPATSAR